MEREGVIRGVLDPNVSGEVLVRDVVDGLQVFRADFITTLLVGASNTNNVNASGILVWDVNAPPQNAFWVRGIGTSPVSIPMASNSTNVVVEAANVLPLSFATDTTSNLMQYQHPIGDFVQGFRLNSIVFDGVGATHSPDIFLHQNMDPQPTPPNSSSLTTSSGRTYLTPSIDFSLWNSPMSYTGVATVNSTTVPLSGFGSSGTISACATNGPVDFDRLTPASVTSVAVNKKHTVLGNSLHDGVVALQACDLPDPSTIASGVSEVDTASFSYLNELIPTHTDISQGGALNEFNFTKTIQFVSPWVGFWNSDTTAQPITNFLGQWAFADRPKFHVLSHQVWQHSRVGTFVSTNYFALPFSINLVVYVWVVRLSAIRQFSVSSSVSVIRGSAYVQERTVWDFEHEFEFDTATTPFIHDGDIIVGVAYVPNWHLSNVGYNLFDTQDPTRVKNGNGSYFRPTALDDHLTVSNVRTQGSVPRYTYSGPRRVIVWDGADVAQTIRMVCRLNCLGTPGSLLRSSFGITPSYYADRSLLDRLVDVFNSPDFPEFLKVFEHSRYLRFLEEFNNLKSVFTSSVKRLRSY